MISLKVKSAILKTFLTLWVTVGGVLGQTAKIDSAKPIDPPKTILIGTFRVALKEPVSNVINLRLSKVECRVKTNVMAVFPYRNVIGADAIYLGLKIGSASEIRDAESSKKAFWSDPLLLKILLIQLSNNSATEQKKFLDLLPLYPRLGDKQSLMVGLQPGAHRLALAFTDKNKVCWDALLSVPSFRMPQ